MNKKINAVFLTFSTLILAGCGGGDSGPDTSVSTPKPINPGSSQVVIKVIDGYLANAQVCVDRNSDNVCQNDELLTTKTNALGEIVIQQSDAQYPLIAQILQGITIDSHSGFARKSYEMITAAGSTEITPFTTLSVLNQMSNEDIASALNIPVADVFSDYIAADSTDVQIIARSVALTLNILGSMNAQDILDSSISISDYVSTNAITDPTAIVVKTLAGLETQSVKPTMKETLLSNSVWTFANLNHDTYIRENFRIANFSDTSMTLSDNWDKLLYESEITYNFDGILNAEGTEYLEKFLYVDDNLLIGQASADQTDLNVWMGGDHGDYQSSSFDEEQFKNGSTWYLVFYDDADINIAKMTFSNTGTVEINELSTNSLMTTTFTLEKSNFEDKNIYLNVVLPDESNPLRYEAWFSSGSILVVRDENRRTLSLLTQSLETARSIAQP
ncbi:hypothetical protein [Paraglaciecola sp.]|uniref:hypothetical protein n=1 Tax=Paraglaciecola sp. TaxID=1920173 RepID=UPI00273FD2DD|nr:hypothetical protein [Paraglaciecola sp.]MDP5032507.1 hypothetical protein [Paraglaciecola sp.]